MGPAPLAHVRAPVGLVVDAADGARRLGGVIPLGAEAARSGAAPSGGDRGCVGSGGRRRLVGAHCGGPTGPPSGEAAKVSLLDALVPLCISSWNQQALLGGLWSRSGRVSAKRREYELLLARSDIVLLQEAHGTLADLTLLPRSHEYFGSFGDLGAEEASSTWGGVVIAVSRHLLSRAVDRRVVEVKRGHILQLDLSFRAGAMRILCVHIDFAWQSAALRAIFSELRRRSDTEDILPFVGGDFNLLAEGEFRYATEGPLRAQGDGVRGEIAEAATSRLLSPTSRRGRKGGSGEGCCRARRGLTGCMWASVRLRLAFSLLPVRWWRVVVPSIP